MKLLIKPDGGEVQERMSKICQWRFNGSWWWSDENPAATVVAELKALVKPDNLKPIEMRITAPGEEGGQQRQEHRLFPSQRWALIWLQDGGRDHTWDRVCNDCKDKPGGLHGVQLAPPDSMTKRAREMKKAVAAGLKGDDSTTGL